MRKGSTRRTHVEGRRDGTREVIRALARIIREAGRVDKDVGQRVEFSRRKGHLVAVIVSMAASRVSLQEIVARRGTSDTPRRRTPQCLIGFRKAEFGVSQLLRRAQARSGPSRV